MVTDALIRLAISFIASAGVAFGFRFLLRPASFRSVIANPTITGTGSPRYLRWFGILMALATVVLTLLSACLSYRNRVIAQRADEAEATANYSVIRNGMNTAEPEAFIPTSFESNYVVFTKPKPRYWDIQTDGTWRESYDGATSNIFNAVGTFYLNGCIGLLLRKGGESSFEVFVPSTDCSPIMHFRWGDGNWQELGPMSKVSRFAGIVRR
jgi:hypothetical protein